MATVKYYLSDCATCKKQRSNVDIYDWVANKALKHLFTNYCFTQTKEVLDGRVDGDSNVSYCYQLRSD